MFSKKFIVGPSDADQNFNAKISTLFIYMQDISMEHSEVLGIGKDATTGKGMMWVITRYSLSIKRLPRYLEEITVSTYTGKDMKFIFPRHYEMRDKDNNLLITASATWMVLDKDTHRVVLNPFNGKKLVSESYEWEEPLPEKVQPQPSTLIDQRKTRNSDVDINNHLNNTRYIEYLIDSHDFDFYRSHEIKHLTLEYQKEIKINQMVEIYSNNKEPEFIEAKVNGEVCFEAIIEYL